MVGVDPSDREAIVISLLDLQASLSKATGKTVKASRSQDLGDVMRSMVASESPNPVAQTAATKR